jgi:hypothetical protein
MLLVLRLMHANKRRYYISNSPWFYQANYRSASYAYCTVISQHTLLQSKHRNVVKIMRVRVTLLDVTGSNGHGTSTMIAS